MNYIQNTLLLSILLIPKVFLATEKNNINNDFKKKMCASTSSGSALMTFGQLFRGGWSIPVSFAGAMTTGFGTYWVCSKVTNIDSPFENFPKIYNKSLSEN